MELRYLSPRVDKFNKRHEYIPYEYDKYLHVIDVSGIKGSVSEADDLLVSNFWALFLGLIRDTNPGDVVATDGAAYSLRCTADVNNAAAYLVHGTSSVPETFTDNALRSYVGSITTTITTSILTDRSRVSLSGILPATSYELGIYQRLYDTSAYIRTIMLARTVGSWESGTAVVYNVDFIRPWVANAAYLTYGILKNTDEGMTKLDGSGIIARTSAEVNAASAYLVASPSTIAWSPSLYNIPDALSLTTHGADVLGTRSLRYTAFVGVVVPSTDITVNSLGLYQLLYDSGGGTFTACLLALPLDSPITFYAGRNNCVVLRILAM